MVCLTVPIAFGRVKWSRAQLPNSAVREGRPHADVVFVFSFHRREEIAISSASSTCFEKWALANTLPIFGLLPVDCAYK